MGEVPEAEETRPGDEAWVVDQPIVPRRPGNAGGEKGLTNRGIEEVKQLRDPEPGTSCQRS
ncbi:MAG: hypothetical protein ACQEQO_11135 [Thermodesulfobacteriota bacterium]